MLALTKQYRKPRVVLFTYPGLVGTHVINTFAQTPGIDLVGIGLSARVFKGANHLQSVRRMIRHSGWRFTAWEILMTDLAWIWLRIKRAPSVLSKVEILRVSDINGASTVAWLQDLKPDYIASCFFNQVIDHPVIDLPTLGCLNMHAGPLPHLRGPEPCFRALERGYRETGLTIHRIVDKNIDTGPILHQEFRIIPPKISVSELDSRLWGDGARVLADWLASHTTVTKEMCHQSSEDGDYTSWPSTKEVDKFLHDGGTLIDYKAFRRELINAASHQLPEYLQPPNDS